MGFLRGEVFESRSPGPYPGPQDAPGGLWHLLCTTVVFIHRPISYVCAHTHTQSHLHTPLPQASTSSLTWTTMIGSLPSDLASNPSPSGTRKICPSEFSLNTPPKACQHNLWPYRTNLDLSKVPYRLFLT